MKKFILSISLVLLLTPAFAQHKWGVVNLSVNYMREKPDYDEEMGDQALMGTVVEVLDKEG